jgi:3-deoxy-D-manno-octulosonic-acid transferase
VPVYRFAIQLLILGLRLAAVLGHRKARVAWRGRSGWLQRFSSAAQQAASRGRIGPWVHFHCASLGEFEQGAPIIQAWRDRHPETPMLLTFFSPSGIEGVDAPWVDHIDYLPLDAPRAMRRFSEALEISDSVLIKYELWPELIRALHFRRTRLHLVAARFDSGRHPLGRWGGFIRNHLGLFSTIQVQDKRSAAALQVHGLTAEVTGDPRADRVMSTLKEPAAPSVEAHLDRLRKWKGNRQLIVVGSAWPDEWNALREIAGKQEHWAVLWAPHEVGHPRVKAWAEPSDSALWSREEESEEPNLILDQIGILKAAYSLADFAVVGGGWGQGVHNVLEPAVFGIPILCGPRVAGFREIEALREAGGLKVCDTPEALFSASSTWMLQAADRQRAGTAASGWVRAQEGAAIRIIDIIEAAGTPDRQA